MKKGDIVNIYEDPITKKVEEGKAKLLRRLQKNDTSEIWKVRFIDDNSITIRSIIKS